DDDFGAKRTGRRYRHGVDQGAIDQPAIADQHGREDARKGVGGAHGIDHAAMGQPDFMAGANFSRYAREFARQILDQGVADGGFELRRKLLAADQAASVQADVEIAENVAHLQAERPLLQRVEMAGRERAADNGTDRGTDHDVRHDAVREQRLHDADMGKSARGAAAERKADDRPADTAEADLVARIRIVLVMPGQNIEHRKLLQVQTSACRPAPPETTAHMVYAAGGQVL